MQIKSILARLQSALGRDDLMQQMLLLPESNKASRKTKSGKTIKLVVGYDGSLNSQTALDLTLWIAYQTRLATRKQVVVHVVYVVDTAETALNVRYLPAPLQTLDPATIGCWGKGRSTPRIDLQRPKRLPQPAVLQGYPSAGEEAKAAPVLEPECVLPNFQTTDSIEHADYVLWQARCLAEEWRGSLEAHLRFGAVAEELRSVAESESADLLLLGCDVTEHRLAKQLAKRLPCPILGIPYFLPCPSSEAAGV